MDSDLRFAVSEIKEQGGLSVETEVSTAEFAADGLFGEAKPMGPATLDAEFSVGGSHILVEGRVECRWERPCNRCLGPVESTLGVTLEETYPLTLDTIDLTEDIRQTLALSLPAKVLCREECAGLCAKCGANKNQGPCRCA